MGEGRERRRESRGNFRNKKSSGARFVLRLYARLTFRHTLKSTWPRPGLAESAKIRRGDSKGDERGQGQEEGREKEN